MRRPLAILASCALLAAVSGCVVYRLGPADQAQLQDSAHLEAQAYRDLDPEAGVAPALVRWEVKRFYCSDVRILQREGTVDDAGMELPCDAAGGAR